MKKNEIIALELLLGLARLNLSCTNPYEIDYHEYVACGQCFNCQCRQKLSILGYTEFWQNEEREIPVDKK